MKRLLAGVTLGALVTQDGQKNASPGADQGAAEVILVIAKAT